MFRLILDTPLMRELSVAEQRYQAPPESVCPVVFIDAIHVKIRDGQVAVAAAAVTSASGGGRGQTCCTTGALIAWSRKSAGTSGHWGCQRADRWSARSSESVAATYGPPSTR